MVPLKNGIFTVILVKVWGKYFLTLTDGIQGLDKN